MKLLQFSYSFRISLIKIPNFVATYEKTFSHRAFSNPRGHSNLSVRRRFVNLALVRTSQLKEYICFPDSVRQLFKKGVKMCITYEGNAICFLQDSVKRVIDCLLGELW